LDKRATHRGIFSALESNEENICVWALNKNYLNMTPPGGQIAFHEKLSKNGLEFLHIQRGLFTDLIGIEAYYYTYGKWPTLNEYLLTTLRDPHSDQPIDQEKYLKKIELKYREKNELLKRLDRMNINKAHLMPTYDNVGRSVIPRFGE
jgi:hypothetical protein